MLIAAAVCPHPPLLVPEVAAGAAHELDGLRAACDEAVRRLVRAGPDLLVVVGAGDRTVSHGPAAGGGLAAYGVAVEVGPAPRVLPLSLTIGRWLVERVDGGLPLRFQEVAAGTEPGVCAALGGKLGAAAPRVALLAMGDGSARRLEKAPGFGADPRAVPFDEAVARALGTADVAALAGIDPFEVEELKVVGRPAWQVLAGAAEGRRFTAELLADEAPYGVAYQVAAWTAAWTAA
ncbi:MAG: hypothetical protein GEV11_05875 [Streptosporangiales bacterium]|nr:hypothetical protein [Streptosporangiales bacterium]